MHSRIFQVSKTPIPKEEWLKSRDIEDTFKSMAVAEWVADIPDEYESRTKQLEWLGRNLKDSAETELFNGGDTVLLRFREDARKKYFEPRCEQFKEILCFWSLVSLDMFMTNIFVNDVCNMLELVDDKNGFYIVETYSGHRSADDFTVMTMDEWMRDPAIDGSTWYAGSVFDYHW